MSLRDKLVEVVGAKLADVVLSASRVYNDTATVFKDTLHKGLSELDERKRTAIIKRRSDILNITPEWYESIAKSYGEEVLIEAVLQKSRVSRKGLIDWVGLVDDPYEPATGWGSWRERQSLLSFDTLDMIARRVAPFTAYIQTRLNQVMAYADPQQDNHGPGFIVRRRDEKKYSFAGKKDKKKPTNSVDSRALDIAEAIVNSGFTPRYDETTGERRDGFLAFVRKLIRDSLIYDQVAIEKRRSRDGRLMEWRVLDAKTIRTVSRQVTEGVINEFGEPIKYVQVMHGGVVAEFSPIDLGFAIRNPRTDVRTWGYGYSEAEMMVSTITALLSGFEHNARYFSQGTTTKGLLAIHGMLPQHEMRAFRRRWTAMVTGAHNAWRTPVLSFPDEKSSVKWIDIQKSNLDMEWSKFMDWLVRVMCGILQIAPEEIGFQLGNMGQSHSLTEASVAEKIESSKDRGLRPLLRWLEQVINEEIIWQIDDRYELVFVGLDWKTERQEIIALKDEVSNWKTVNEAREARNLPPLKKGGDIILNPHWIQVYQQEMMAEQQSGGFPMFSGGGEPFSDSNTRDAVRFPLGSEEDESKDVLTEEPADDNINKGLVVYRVEL